MAEYNFREIEKFWKEKWERDETYKVSEDPDKKKYYVLDMFPYPSGAGLHVGHPLGYIATDIFSRFRTLQGFNVLHPMGFDAFGLPAEQYAIETGQHPAITTENNIQRYKEQLKNIGFSYDWSRELRTSDPSFYKWTQWIFIKLFECWYNRKTNKAESISSLTDEFSLNGNSTVDAEHDYNGSFSASDWQKMSEDQKQKVLLQYRLAYLADTTVNWCPELGTVLANEEVKDGLSERGGYPVIKKEMKQWSLRITAYADRLLNDLEKIDWPEAVVEMQKNWIGKSSGAEVDFQIQGSDKSIRIFTTRPDTIFGATFMVLAPEHELIDELVPDSKRSEVMEYVKQAINRSERERMSDVKTVSGVYSGINAIHPFSGDLLPVWIADYVLAGYGTGAVMAVPAHDSRDHAFAKQFNIPIIQVIESEVDIQLESHDAKEGKVINSDFLNGLDVKKAIESGIQKIEEKGIGKRRTNYRLRDAIFSRQRYWGEPFPVYFKNDLPYVLNENELPLTLPEIDEYKPTESGEPPLARASNWKTKDGYPYETSTMPGWAGSSWYFLRYMDPENNSEFVDPEKADYWKEVDLYMGGSEHATGHLLYLRFWTKFLYDLGYIKIDEPAKKLINQGMIQGRSNFVYRIQNSNQFVSYNLKDQYSTTALHVDVNIVENDILDLEAFKKWRAEFSNAEFLLEDGKYYCGYEIAKMSKRWYNVVNPDDVIERYGADAFRLYEMFLGPVEQSKPWNTNSIDGVGRFLRKLWRLFHDDNGNLNLSGSAADNAELKILHKTIKKVTEDIERFSFNTCVSTFMICVNELGAVKCNKREILEPLIILISPFAPNIAEELWKLSGKQGSITKQDLPKWNDAYLVENSFNYPVSINGKVRTNIEFPLDYNEEQIRPEILNNSEMIKWIEGKPVRKLIFVKGKIINVVI